MHLTSSLVVNMIITTIASCIVGGILNKIFKMIQKNIVYFSVKYL